MRTAGIPALLTIASLLAACAPTNVRTVSESFAPTGGPDDFAEEAGAHDILVTVRGTAFGLDPKAFDAALVDRMQGQAWGANPRFVLEPDPAISKIFSVILIVGAPGSVNSLALCAHPESVQPLTFAADDPLHISAVLCRFDKTVAGVEGFADNVSIVEDPRVGSLVAATVRELTREQRSNRLRRDD